MPVPLTSSIIEIDSSPEPGPLSIPPNRRRTRSQGPPTPPSMSNTSPKRKAPTAIACSKKKGRILGPVIELTDSEDDEDVPMRLAPKPSQGSVNAVASGSGTRHSEEAESEVEVDEYDPVFAAKPFPFNDAFLTTSQKTPLQASQPVAGPSRIRSSTPAPVSVLRTPVKSQGTPSRPASSYIHQRTPHTPRLLAELDGYVERVQHDADENAAPKPPVPQPIFVAPDAPRAPISPPRPVQPIHPPDPVPAVALVVPEVDHAPAPPVPPIAPVALMPPPASEPLPIVAPAPIQSASIQPAPAAPPDPDTLIQLAMAQVRDVLPDIDRAFLKRIVRANVPTFGAETGPRVVCALMDNMAWPKEGGDNGQGRAVNGALPPAVLPARVSEPAVVLQRAPALVPGAPAIPAPAPAPIQPEQQPPPPAAAAVAVDVEALVQLATAQVLDILPSVERAYLDRCVRAVVPQRGQEAGAAVLGALVEQGEWPKEKPILVAGPDVGTANAKGKGRAMDEPDAPAEGKRVRIDYESVDRPSTGGVHYMDIALINLQCAFPYTPKAYLRRVLSQHRGHYAPTYMYLHTGEREWWDQGYIPNKTCFDARRREALVDGRRDEVLEDEIRWVEGRIRGVVAEAFVNAVDKGKGKERAVDDDEPPAAMDDAVAEEDGEIECQCCFADYPFTQMVQCPEAHLFCTGCLKTYASTQLAASSASLLCMHSSGCALPFPPHELERALPKSLMELYERVTAAKAVEEAGLEGLEACPFCEWQCVMEVGGEERLFRCGNVGRCGVVSCRECKKKDHLPKTCEEMEADKHLDGRHAIEEAMTRALMRNCPKCKKAFIKEHGCNKMTCPNCRTLSCYVCRKAITGYDHFHQNNPRQVDPIAQGSNGKCLLWDEVGGVDMRHVAEVKAAAEKAAKEYRQAHPDVDEAAIQVDIPVAPPPQPLQAPPHPLPVFLAPLPAAQVNGHFPAHPPPLALPIYRPAGPAPPKPKPRGRNQYAQVNQRLAALPLAGPLPPRMLPPPQPHVPQVDAQALERHRMARHLAERERQAHEAAVRMARKEEQRERKAAHARMQEAMVAQMQAMEAQREYGRRQMALEMQREQMLALPKEPMRRPQQGPR